MPLKRKLTLTQERFDAVARAVADPRRFAILKQVAASEVTPCSSLHAQDEISPATISHHVKELHEAGLIDIVRQGRTADLSLNRRIWQAYLDKLSAL